MRAEEIRDRESFEAWLNARPAAERRTEAFTLAHRSAMRTLPFVHRSVHSISDSDNRLITQVFFCNVVARVAARNGFLPSETAIVSDSRMADLETRAREEVRERNSEYSRAESDFAIYRRRVSLSVALAGAVAAARAAIHGNAFDAASAFNGVEFFDAFIIVWDETILDAKNLEKGQSHLELLATPILRRVPSWWMEILGNFSLYLDKLPMSQGGLSALLDWYKDVSSGKPIFGLRGVTMRNTLERNIALGSTDGTFNKKFWERDPPEINADIARWVEEARQEDSEVGSSDLEDDALKKVENQNPVAPVFLADGSGPIDLDDRQGQSTVSNTRDNRDGHFEVRRLAQAILTLDDTEGASRNNDNQTAYDGARLLLDALGSNLNEIRPALLIPRGEALRQLLLKQFEMDYLAEVPPCSDKVKDALKAWQAAYNPFVALDPELARRDEAIVGPDAKRVQVAPEEAKSEARLAFDLGAITPVAKAAIDESAAIAPVMPSFENRNSRRLTETAKNLLRAVVVKVQTFVHWVRANPVVSLAVAGAPYAAACWAVRSEEWLMRVFFGHETILSIIRPLLAFLKTLPL